MADFAIFCLNIAYDLGLEERVMEIFQKMAKQQAEFALKEDPLYILLCRWVEMGNAGKWINARNLADELSMINQKEQFSLQFNENARSIAQRLNSMRNELQRFFRISERKGHGNLKQYCFDLVEVNDDK